MIGRMNGVPVEGYLRDVGTLEGLHRAELEWRSRLERPSDLLSTRPQQ
jgi:NDP-sugar pyrophosphorylase family protein